jgi:hypothetical protein
MIVIPPEVVKEWIINMKQPMRLIPIFFEDDGCVIDLSRFPHKCPLCNNPAYLGANVVECSNTSCRHGTKVI